MRRRDMKPSKDEVKQRLKSMKGWKLDGGEIEKDYKFKDFKESMLFVNAVARAAEAMDHHPEIDIRYNHVEISLITHSENGITEKDFALATQIDNVAAGASV
jgi:4a-hydroxytetrahydrobiopterin dehydratase